ncbi:MAG: S-formylglutathione hydrolase [Gammaproteobacteria bacterium]|nr:S-formylglutathione hydrolase [Gammaproteobacteria bacterium]MCF6338819.1 S-formylglutathione hydrolase [Gammaproteobacteria bacterium]
MQKTDTVKEFDGWLSRYLHTSEVCHCEMTFSIYLPAQAEMQPVPVLYWLSGLTCTDDNFRIKAGAQRYAAEHGIALVMPDTSPRGDNVPDVPDRYNLGKGAGFYIDAIQPPWNKNYKMYSYITKELPQLIEKNFPVTARKSISGHSMGGHGALTCALKNPEMYQSVSAFSPVCHPTECTWGKEVFQKYLGNDKSEWAEYDTCHLIEKCTHMIPILIDQGTNDEFLDDQLMTQKLQYLCEKNKYPLDLRMRTGYDHSYHFISTFIGDHIRYHSNILKSTD